MSTSYYHPDEKPRNQYTDFISRRYFLLGKLFAAVETRGKVLI